MTSSHRLRALGFAAAIVAALAGPALSLAHGAEHAEERHRARHEAEVRSSAQISGAAGLAAVPRGPVAIRSAQAPLTLDAARRRARAASLELRATR